MIKYNIEVWKDIDGYIGFYQVSSFGNIKSLDRITKRSITGDKKTIGIVLKLVTNKKGYKIVCLSKHNNKKNIPAHRLVAKSFIENPENKPQVNHINGIKYDNVVDNLEWCTNSENQIHAYKTGLNKSKQGESNFYSKLKETDILHIRSTECKSKKLKELAEELKVSITTISDIKNRKIWIHI